MPKARKKRVLATEKPPAAALLGTPQRAATAQHLPTGAQEQPAQAVQPGSPARLQQEPVLEAAPQPKEDIAFHELEEQVSHLPVQWYCVAWLPDVHVVASCKRFTFTCCRSALYSSGLRIYL